MNSCRNGPTDFSLVECHIEVEIDEGDDPFRDKSSESFELTHRPQGHKGQIVPMPPHSLQPNLVSTYSPSSFVADMRGFCIGIVPGLSSRLLSFTTPNSIWQISSGGTTLHRLKSVAWIFSFRCLPKPMISWHDTSVA
jgi:hypothetical protein